MRALWIFMLAAVLAAGAAEAATIVIVNIDGAGEGFNDQTLTAPVGGNPGTTIGAQRLNLFQRAAEIWGGLLESDVTIRIESSFDPLSCNSSGGVLGSAGPIVVNRDFSGAEVADTWYHGALSDKLAGVDLDPGDNDIRARFNLSIDNNENCLSGSNWYYGFDGNAGSDIALLPVLLHEMAHGLGFSTFVDAVAGSEFFGSPDIYERFIRDNTTGLNWDQMTNSQRATSATNTDNLVWSGEGVTSAAPQFLGGVPTLVVNAPGSLPGTMALGSAAFGPALDETGLTGDLVLAEDGSTPTGDACGDLVNGALINGNIALIDRGTCTFVSKALRAQAVGARAVIIIDNVAAAAPPNLGGSDSGVTIPTVSITRADGDLLKAELAGGVNVTLQLDADLLAGADTQGRVKLYAPNPYQGGSSISHFDVSATPSLLMEPAITPSLNDEVDLTLAHFGDIGWFEAQVAAAGDLPPTRSALSAAYPNPFNPATRIAFRVGSAGPVRVAVHDASGRLVRVLVAETLAAGEYVVAWRGDDDAGRRVSSGVYFYRLETKDHRATRKMVMLK